MASQANNFFGAFSIFESGGIAKHLMTGPSGNRPRPQCSPRLRLGEHWASRGNKTHCFPCGQSLSAYSFKQSFLFFTVVVHKIHFRQFWQVKQRPLATMSEVLSLPISQMSWIKSLAQVLFRCLDWKIAISHSPTTEGLWISQMHASSRPIKLANHRQ